MTPQQHIATHAARGRHFLAGGRRSFVLDEGEGEPVVCVHGVPTSSYLYRKVVHELAARGLRGIAFDLPGLGLAERPHALDGSWTALGAWSVAAIDALGLERVHLVVHDIGGPIGFEMAALLGDRVASLTILNAITDPASFTKPLPMRPFEKPVLDRLWLGGMTDWAFVALMRRMGVADRQAASAAELAAHRHLLVREDGGRAFLRIMHAFETTPEKSALYRDVIRGVERRQIVWGEDDPALTLDHHGEIAREVAGLHQIHRVPGRHFLQEDQAPTIAEHVAALVKSA